MSMTPSQRAALVAAAHHSIAKGSQSFAAASKLFSRATRERAWLLYAWCRAADDMTDGQDMGHGGNVGHDALAGQAELAALTASALDGADPDTLPLPFIALREVAAETSMPRALITDHLAGFALDAADWRPQSTDDLLRYCYHVAGSVGCMMALVMGVSPTDEDTLNRACDLGLAFQLANIARDIVPDAEVGRCYIPQSWLDEFGLTETTLAAPKNRPALAHIAERLVTISRPYRASARVGAARLPMRSRLAVLAADAIYGAIGEKVVQRGTKAWDERVRVSTPGKVGRFALAFWRSGVRPPPASRASLWTRRAYCSSDAG